ncbi:proteophosphoglycan ppg4 [Colletotrichum incanum]|uniref:Proteophosphoglycan ppg4 n=1 Tax=Colletotrichum incanum TaxID=1573173 RepID=A0A166ZIZ6_COLIC|nr:proteophosphoglycan ppg4 [Colletotrichum incanum]
MGNTHSTESSHYQQDHVEPNSRRSPHKLSKPRVGNHASPTPTPQATRLLSSHGRTASSSLPPSRSNSQLTPRTLSSAPSPVEALSGSQFNALIPAPDSSFLAEPETRPTKNWKRRASLFRSKSSQEPRKGRRRDTVTLSPPVPDRMSRANSMTWETQREMNTSRQLQVESWHIPGNRQSINYNLMSYESRRLLNLTEDLASCEENSIMSESRFEVLPSTWKSSHPHQPAISQLPRANSEVSLYAPVRRRSMIQTPGLATRLPTEYPASRRSSLRHSVPNTPAGGRSRLNSIESSAYPIQPLTEYSSEPDYLPAPVTEPVERALTPSDMDYRPLGAMKFGSLRITNGVASPLPSPDFEPQAKAEVTEKSPGGNEEYFIRDAELGKSGLDSKDVGITVSAVHASTVLSPMNTSFLPVGSRRQCSNSPLSPELQTTSKHSALEDELFEDDVQMEYSAEVLTVRNDPNAKPSLERLRAEQSQKNSQAIVRTDSGVVASPTVEQPKSLSKADSGYSSNVSLRSFHAKQSAAGVDQRPCTTSEDSGDEQSDDVASPITADSNGSPTASRSNADGLAIDPLQTANSTPPPLQPKDDFLASPKSPAKTISSPKFFFNLNAGHSFRKDRKAPAAIDSAKLAKEGPTSPESVRSGVASSDISTSALSIGTGSQRAGKFQRLINGSGMRGPPAVHATHPSDKPVPSVPQDVQVKLDEHSERFPTTTKRLTLRTQASKDTLNTILSVGSFVPSHVEDGQRSMLPADSNQLTSKPFAETPQPLEKPTTPRRRSFQSVPASIAHAAASVMPRRSIHRKPLPSNSKDRTEFVGETRADEIQVGFESSITAIDNVGGSVGKSAFDQAFMALPSQQPVRAPRERTLTMTAQMERDMSMFHSAEPMPSATQHPDLRASQNLEVPDVAAKRRSSPPISLHTRNTKNTRKQAPRPKSAHSSEATQSRRQTLLRQASRETIHSYPSTSTAALDDTLSVPPIPPMSPRRGMAMLEQQYATRRMTVEDRWRPTNGWGPDLNQDARPVMQGLATSTGYPQQQLRHRSSYDSYTQFRGPVARGPIAVTQSPSQSGSYYQQQLLNVQQQQWEQQGYYSPDAVQPGLSRSRSRSRSVHANGNLPYRVLHSYNSPAYRNVPIWG